MNVTDRLFEDYSRCGFQDLLLIGKDAGKALESLYKRFKFAGYAAVWIQEPKDEKQFWYRLKEGMKADPEGFSRMMLYMEQMKQADSDYSKLMREFGSIRERVAGNMGRTYLFIPDLDASFHRFDAGKATEWFSSRLHEVQFNLDSKLHICGSAKSTQSEEYRATLNQGLFSKCGSAFSEEDFLIFEQIEEISPNPFVRCCNDDIYGLRDAFERKEEMRGEILEKRTQFVR
jgi:hypothetical protein